MNLRNIDLNLLTVFDTIIRTGKLSAAADQLGMTQPACSNALARLRLTFNDDLFIRTRYGMTPTQMAEDLAKPIREALGLIEGTLGGGAAFDPDTSTRTFKLAIGDYGEIILLPPLLNLVRQYAGDLTIKSYPELETSSLDLVRQGQIDFYFDFKAPTDKQLLFCELSEEETVVIARKGNPRYTSTISRKEYLDADHIILTYRHQGLSMLDALLRQEGPIPRKSVAEVNQYVAVPGLVAKTDCIATVPKHMADYFAKREAINIFPLPFKMPKSKTYMIWHRSMESDKGHQWLKEIILKLGSGPNAERIKKAPVS